ncbi:hypothetical protein DDM60_002665 [Vibrio cholerae]
MPLLKQEICSPNRTGKTTMLLALASGYSALGLKGVIVLKNQEYVHDFQSRSRNEELAGDFQLWTANELWDRLKFGRVQVPHQVFLIDDAEHIDIGGDLIKKLEETFADSPDFVVLMSFVSKSLQKQDVLMSKYNPDGWKLEHLAEKLRSEINRKSLNIAGDASYEAQLVTNNNFQIIGLLMQVEALQRESMVIMSSIGPDQGPLGRSRFEVKSC